jgi:arylsulfatase A-like enzyme
VPELTDFGKEPARVLEAYGPEVKRPGSYAANCLLARRLAERGVRFVQLFHMGWDHHGGLPAALRGQCRDTDQPTAALLDDLKRLGLLDDTLLVWGGEFGRTVYSQGALTEKDYGRDHHPRCFTVWLAGGGVKGGVTHGETDDFCYNVVSNPVSVHDLHATILHLLGIDHERLTFKFQGLDARLTGVEPSRVVKEVLA